MAEKLAEKLIDQKINDYLDVLKSEAPAPGGGAVAALTGAQGAALVMMVANLTIGKKKYADEEALNIQVRDAAEEELQILMKGVDDDKEAFQKVSAAYGMPKDTDEQKAARKEAIAVASVSAAEAPLNAMRAAERAMKLTLSLIGHSNKNLVSDLYVAALNLQACVEAAKFNVNANVPYIKDEKLAASWKEESDGISVNVRELAAKVLEG